MRHVERPIEVAFREGQKWPYLFRVGEESFEVRTLLRAWIRESGWWRTEGPERRVYYRVVADPGKTPNVICVLCRAKNSDLPTWSLQKIEDSGQDL